MLGFIFIIFDFAAVIFMLVKNDMFTKLLPTVLSIINIVLGGFATLGLGVSLFFVWCVDQLDYSPTYYGPLVIALIASATLVVLSIILLNKELKLGK